MTRKTNTTKLEIDRSIVTVGPNLFVQNVDLSKTGKIRWLELTAHREWAAEFVYAHDLWSVMEALSNFTPLRVRFGKPVRESDRHGTIYHTVTRS